MKTSNLIFAESKSYYYIGAVNIVNARLNTLKTVTGEEFTVIEKYDGIEYQTASMLKRFAWLTLLDFAAKLESNHNCIIHKNEKTLTVIKTLITKAAILKFRTNTLTTSE